MKKLIMMDDEDFELNLPKKYRDKLRDDLDPMDDIEEYVGGGTTEDSYETDRRTELNFDRPTRKRRNRWED